MKDRLSRDSGVTMLEAGVLVAIFISLAAVMLPEIALQVTKRNCGVGVIIRSNPQPLDPNNPFSEATYWTPIGPKTWKCYNVFESFDPLYEVSY